MSASRRREAWESALRFVVAGGANTLVTGALLSLLAQVIAPPVAYTIVFVLGIAMSAALAGSFVFRVRMTVRQTAAYVVMYLIVFLVGLGLVTLAERTGVPSAWSGLVVLVTAPLSFVGGWFLLRRKPAPSALQSEVLP